MKINLIGVCSCEFDPQKEDWISYSEQLQVYFAANKIENGDKEGNSPQCGRCRNLPASAKPGST